MVVIKGLVSDIITFFCFSIATTVNNKGIAIRCMLFSTANPTYYALGGVKYLFDLCLRDLIAFRPLQ